MRHHPQFRPVQPREKPDCLLVCLCLRFCTRRAFCLAPRRRLGRGFRYGDHYDRYGLCRWEGYKPSECDFLDDQESYGPNTDSIRATEESLAFFEKLL